MSNMIEQWGLFEVSLPGRRDGNPFTERFIRGEFRGPTETVTVDGFYDGEGIYKVRFMPSGSGEYTYTISGNHAVEVTTGSFTALPPSPGNHGPVRVAGQYHLAYADGTPYYSAGTTCYAWTHQTDERVAETLIELRKGYFNKMRFCVLPKHYIYNFHDPVTFPFEGTPVDNHGLTRDNFFASLMGDKPGNDWDFTRLNPEHFRRIERGIAALLELGIEADLIVMHPYDRWGFSTMTREQDDLYWKYVIARFAAYRNVWWSLANEYDLMRSKTEEDWEHYAALLLERDPYGRLRSIHNCMKFYDHSRPWITHCSIQRVDMHKTAEFTADWREQYQKPVVLDEICYEGNIDQCWGNISGRELVRRFWEAAVRGGYAGHGETYTGHDDVLWWSHGGPLWGESPARIRFLQGILTETPGLGLRQRKMKSHFDPPFTWDDVVGVPEDERYANSYFLIYFGNFRPSFRDYHFDDTTPYEVEVIDTWDMTVEKRGVFTGKIHIELPGREYMAIRIFVKNE